MNVIQSIYKEPEKWKQTTFTMVHSNGLEIWTRNGFFFYAPYPGGVWSFWMKWRFRKARLWWSNNIQTHVLSMVVD